MAYFIQGSLAEQVATTTALGGTTTFTLLSKTYQKFTGTSTQTIILPDATTLVVGRRYQIDSRTTGTLTINYNSGSFATDVLAYTGKTLVLVDNSSSDGTWTISVAADTKEPLALSQTLGVADARLFISASQVRAEDGTTKTLSPLGSLLPSFVETTVNFQTAATVGGTVTRDGGAFSLPSTTIGQFRRVAFAYNSSANAVDTTFSAAAASQGALTAAGTLFALISGTPLGYIDLVATASTSFKTAGSSTSVIENIAIFRATASGTPPLATASVPGLVSTTTQTYAGPKTFNDATTFKAASGTIAAGGYDGSGQWILGDAATALPVTIKGSGSSNLLTLQAFSSNNGIIELIANVGAANNSIFKMTSGASGNGIIRLGHASAGFKIQNSSSVDLASMAAGGAWTLPVSVQTPIVILTTGGASGTTKLTLSGTTWQIGGTVSTITEAGTFSGLIGAFSASVNTAIIQNTAAAALDIKAASGQAIRFAAGGAAAGAHGNISALGSLTISSTTDHLFNGNLTFPTGKGIEASAASSTLNFGTTTNAVTANLGTGDNVSVVNIGTGTGVATVNIGGSNDTTIILGLLSGRGVAPLGSIIAITSGLTGAFALPGSGSVSSGWMRADGSVIPGGNLVSGTTPNLSGSVYMRGNSSYNPTPIGSNTTTLSAANLPAHAHVMDHGHSDTFSVSGSFASSGHTHDMNHIHQTMYSNANAYYMPNISGASLTTFTTDQIVVSQNFLDLHWSANNGQFFVYGLNVSNINGPWYSARAVYTDGATLRTDTGGPSGTASGGISGSVTNMTGSTGNGPGSGTAFGIEPKYIDVVYLIRVN